MSVHVYPVGDLIEHELDTDCICGPHIEWIHPDTGTPHAEPLVTHHSLDGREHREP